ncbi:MAG: MBL fold metallo-hydrolase [Planctomycetota bacterium]
MILKQFYLACLAHASYIIIDERTKKAAVIDPQRDIDQYLVEAAKYDASIDYVFLTHFHADFVAGHVELRQRAGSRIYLGAAASAEYEFAPVADGDVIEFGDVRLKILATPGHTPEGISILAFDLSDDDRKPHAVFTGDTLFVGDVGRPDLMASVGVSAQELAGMLYDSLHEKILTLPDETIVYPAHGAGSMCGKSLGKETFTTIGAQRQLNYALQPMSKSEFIEIVTKDQQEAPAYFSYDAQMNRMERETLDATLRQSFRPLSLDKVRNLRDDGAQIVDVREPADFAGAHFEGSINLPLDGRFATWAGSLLNPERSIIIVAEPRTEHEASMRLGRIGFDRVVGYLDGGMGTLQGRNDLIESNRRTTVNALWRTFDGKEPLCVIDVRSTKEWEAGHIAESHNIALGHLTDRLDELPREHEFALICRTGYRSSVASSLLLRRGIMNFRDVIGGMEAWSSSELPVVEPTENSPVQG